MVTKNKPTKNQLSTHHEIVHAVEPEVSVLHVGVGHVAVVNQSLQQAFDFVHKLFPFLPPGLTGYTLEQAVGDRNTLGTE